MNFDFSQEQKSMQDEVHRFLRDKSDLSVARAVLESDSPYAAELWASIVELGWPAIALPEAYGGIGLGYLELCVMAEEMGRFLTPVPFASTVYLFAEAILAGGSEEQKQYWLPNVAAGECIGTLAYSEAQGFPRPDTLALKLVDGKLYGTKVPVADGDVADAAVVLARDEAGTVRMCIASLKQHGVTATPLKSVDPTRSQARLEFDGAECDPLANGGWDVFQRVLDAAAVLFAFEQIGGADACLKAAVEFARERKAFGRIIGSFQAIKHKLADMYVNNELARSNAYYGAWALSTGAEELPLAAAVARVSAIHAYEYATKENVQTHGGMGFTWEADCHLYLRRSRSLAVNLGGTHLWKENITAQLEAGRGLSDH